MRLFICILLIVLLYGCKEVKKEYYENGNIKSEIPLKGDIINGTAKHYYDDGSLKQEVSYINGVKTGLSKNYFHDGTLNWECFYENDKHNGLFKEYSSQGVLILESNLKMGQQNGSTKAYYPNGKIKSISEYKNGVQFGEFKEYYSSGKILMFALFEKGETVYYKKYDEQEKVQEEFRLVRITPSDTIIHNGDVYKAKIKVYGPSDNIIIRGDILTSIVTVQCDLPEIPSKNGETIFEAIAEKTGIYYLNVQVYVGKKVDKIYSSTSKIVVEPKQNPS